MAIKYIPIYNETLRELGKGIGLYYSYLVMIDKYVKKRSPKTNEWIFYANKACRDIGISTSSQCRYLKELEALGLIKVNTGGFKNRRKLTVVDNFSMGYYFLVDRNLVKEMGAADGIYLSYVDALVSRVLSQKLLMDGFVTLSLERTRNSINYPYPKQREILKKAEDKNYFLIKKHDEKLFVKVKKIKSEEPKTDQKVGAITLRFPIATSVEPKWNCKF